MAVRMVNAIARTIPATVAGFGAMCPLLDQIDVAMPDLEGRIGRDV